MRKITALLLTALAAPTAFAETAVIISAGQSEFTIGDKTKNSPTFSVQGTYSTISGDADTGGIFQAALGASMYEGPGGTAGKDDSFGVIDFNATGAAGYRVGPLAVVGMFEGRHPQYSNNKNESGSASYFTYGGGLRCRLGAGGTLLSRFSLQGSYLIGSSDLTELSSAGTSGEKKKYDVTDIKGRLAFTPSQYWVIFGEFRRTDYEAAETSPNSETRRIDSVMLGLGKYL